MGLAAEHFFGSFLLPLTRKNKEKECVVDSSVLTMTHFLFYDRITPTNSSNKYPASSGPGAASG